jgi:dihydroorotase
MSMPNLNPCPDSIENLQVQIELINKNAQVKVYPYSSVTKGEKGNELSDLDDLCPIVKAITDDGVGVNNIDLLIKAMEYAKKYNIVMASHAEDLIDSKLPQGEYVAVRREIELAKKIGCKYHFCHMSTKESFDAIRQAHKEGYTNITCEVSPHHLLLNEEMIKDSNWKMNPPLRSEENRLETIKALLDGTACMIASDHAPHTKEEKEKSYEQAPNGIIGIETMVPLIYTHFVDKGLISLERFIELFVKNPRKIFSLSERKIEVGYQADITVLDINTTRKYTEKEILSLSTNCPYIGMEMKGFPILTIYKGNIVWEEE